MKIDCEWTGKLKFVAHAGNFNIEMDATRPFGNEEAAEPKQHLLASLCGCTGMDVLSLLHKKKQSVDKFTVSAEATTKATHPQILQDIHLKYLIEGDCEVSAVNEAVELSKTKFCSVGAMLSKSSRITYDVILNGRTINNRTTDFIEQFV